MRIIGTVVVIALVFFIIGLLAGWFSITKETSAAGDTRIGVGVHGSEIEQDAESTKEAVKSLGDRIGDAFDRDDEEPTDELDATDETLALAVQLASFEGVLSSVDPNARELTLRTAGGDARTVRLENSARIELDGLPATLLELRAGDRVQVDVRLADGIERATRVIARRS